ncbi:MAG: putative ribosomal N-acetyltransferase YdaF [Chloroflexi bacterium ADurb.Bin325]|nr:MAG: putative ribosomal N-acetyltransferase YdaF [Chloroflexi bacterium ADurb.Bin325]
MTKNMTEQEDRGPAYRIVTPRLVLRCWDPADAPLLKAAIDVSVEHLRPWMSWAAHEPTDLAAKTALLRTFRGDFDLDRNYFYGIFDRDETAALGSSGFHTQVGPAALEIGYWIRADAINQGFATEVTAALTRVAFEVNRVRRVEIHCVVANVRSAAVPRKLGYQHEATLARRIAQGDERHDVMIWTLFAEQYADSPAAGIETAAYDALGRPFTLAAPRHTQ